MDDFGIGVQICSLSTAVESRSSLLSLLLAVIDLYNAADMQIALQSNRLILGGLQVPENLLAALKIEAAQVGAEAGSQSQCSELSRQLPSSGGLSLMNTQTGINDLLKVFMLWTFRQTTFL